MEPVTILGLAAAVVGIIAGIVQVLQYIQDRRKKKAVTKESTASPSVSEASILPEPSVSSMVEIESHLPRREPFVGRVEEKEVVKHALTSLVPVVSIIGIGGIGKSALAREVSYTCLEESAFQGVIWVSARDHKPSFEEILDSVLQSANLNYALKLPLAEKRSLTQKIISQNNLLIVLDSFEEFPADGEIISFISTLPSKSRVLLTTRQAASIDSIPVKLGGLTETEALALIREHSKAIGLRIETVNEALLAHLAKTTGYAPLALKWALGQIKQKGQSIEMVINWIENAKGEIFKPIFNYSWSFLDNSSKLTLQAASIFVAPVTYAAFAGATKLSRSELESAITELAELSLLDASDLLELAQRRYSLHPLTRSFALGQLRQSPNLEHELRASCAHFFLPYAIAYGGEKWNWGSFDALEQEYPNILETIDWYYEQRDWQAIKQFRKSISLFLSIRGHWNKRIELSLRTLEACRETGDDEQYAWCLVYDLAYINLKYNQLEQARERVREGLLKFRQSGNQLGIATATRHLGRIEHMQGNFGQAKKLYQQSYDLYVKEDPEYGAFLLWDMGELYFNTGEYDKAKHHFEESFKQSTGITGKSEAVHAMASGYLGELAMMDGDMEKARSYFLRESQISEKIGRADEIALANRRLAKFTAETTRDYHLSLQYARSAYVVYYQLADYKTCDELKQMIRHLENCVTAGT